MLKDFQLKTTGRIDGGYKFFFDFHDSNQIQEFNLKLRPLIRSTKIGSLLKQK